MSTYQDLHNHNEAVEDLTKINVLKKWTKLPEYCHYSELLGTIMSVTKKSQGDKKYKTSLNHSRNPQIT